AAKSNARARVSKDEDGHGMALMLRDASQRSEAVGAFVLPFALRCSSACGRPRPSAGPAGRPNLWLWEPIAVSPCLFPACYLQGTPQLQRAEPQAPGPPISRLPARRPRIFPCYLQDRPSGV